MVAGDSRSEVQHCDGVLVFSGRTKRLLVGSSILPLELRIRILILIVFILRDGPPLMLYLRLSSYPIWHSAIELRAAKVIPPDSALIQQLAQKKIKVNQRIITVFKAIH